MQPNAYIESCPAQSPGCSATLFTAQCTLAHHPSAGSATTVQGSAATGPAPAAAPVVADCCLSVAAVAGRVSMRGDCCADRSPLVVCSPAARGDSMTMVESRFSTLATGTDGRLIFSPVANRSQYLSITREISLTQIRTYARPPKCSNAPLRKGVPAHLPPAA